MTNSFFKQLLISLPLCSFRVNRKEPETASLLAQSIELKLPFVLLLLNHADDDISECVSEYCMHYIGILKQNKMLTRDQQTSIEVSDQSTNRQVDH